MYIKELISLSIIIILYQKYMTIILKLLNYTKYSSFYVIFEQMLFKHYLYEYAYDIYLMFSHFMHFFINDSSQLFKDIFLSIMFFTIQG